MTGENIKRVEFVEDIYGQKAIALSELVRYNPKLRKWCAKITGYEIKTVGKEPRKEVFFKREWLVKSKLKDGGVGIDMTGVKEGDIIEAHGESWKHTRNKYYKIVEIRDDCIIVEWIGDNDDLSQVIKLLSK